MPPVSSQVVFRVGPDGGLERVVKAAKIVNGVFEGGGALGAGYWEVFQVLEAEGIEFERLAGSSAGACFATLVALGYKGDDILHFGQNFDLSNLKDIHASWMKKVKKNMEGKPHAEIQRELMKAALEYKAVKPSEGKLHDAARAVRRFGHGIRNAGPSGRGLYRGNVLLYVLRARIYEQFQKKIEEHLQRLNGEAKLKFRDFLLQNNIALDVNVDTNKVELHSCPMKATIGVKEHPGITFRHLNLLVKNYPEIGFKDLYLTGSNTKTKKLEIFCHETEPDMEIALAVRISMSLPGAFKSVKYKGVHYIDGGAINNCPADVFNPKNKKDRRFVSKGDEQFTGVHNQNLATLAFKIDTPYEVRNWSYKPKKKKRTALGKLGRWIEKAIGISYFTRGVDYSVSDKKNFNLLREQFPNRTVVIPAYARAQDENRSKYERLSKFYKRYKKAEEPEKSELRTKIETEFSISAIGPDQSFEQIVETKIAIYKEQWQHWKADNAEVYQSANFDMTRGQKEVLSENGKNVTKEYLNQHRDEKLEIKEYKAQQGNAKENFTANLKQLPLNELQEIYTRFKSKGAGDEIFTCWPGYNTEELREAHLQVIRDEINSRYVTMLLRQINEFLEFYRFVESYFPSAKADVKGKILNQNEFKALSENALNKTSDVDKLKQMRDEYKDMTPDLQRKYQIYQEQYQPRKAAVQKQTDKNRLYQRVSVNEQSQTPSAAGSGKARRIGAERSSSHWLGNDDFWARGRQEHSSRRRQQPAGAAERRRARRTS